mmetsp:Transcript_10997/g.17978  ORF Transcript_10997/g.17978 Transcript_10997/m.17978 type:complete len:259 (+) Transcript_10997:760-1536(+)
MRVGTPRSPVEGATGPNVLPTSATSCSSANSSSSFLYSSSSILFIMGGSGAPLVEARVRGPLVEGGRELRRVPWLPSRGSERGAGAGAPKETLPGAMIRLLVRAFTDTFDTCGGDMVGSSFTLFTLESLLVSFLLMLSIALMERIGLRDGRAMGGRSLSDARLFITLRFEFEFELLSGSTIGSSSNVGMSSLLPITAGGIRLATMLSCCWAWPCAKMAAANAGAFIDGFRETTCSDRALRRTKLVPSSCPVWTSSRVL